MEPQDFVQRSGQKFVCHCCPGSGFSSGFREDKVHTSFPPPLPWRVSGGGHRQATYTTVHILSFMFPFSKFHSPLWSSLASPGGLQIHSIRKRTGEEGKRTLAKSQNVDNNVPVAMEHSRISWGCCENQLMFVKAFEFLGGKVPPER